MKFHMLLDVEGCVLAVTNRTALTILLQVPRERLDCHGLGRLWGDYAPRLLGDARRAILAGMPASRLLKLKLPARAWWCQLVVRQATERPDLALVSWRLVREPGVSILLADPVSKMSAPGPHWHVLSARGECGQQAREAS